MVRHCHERALSIPREARFRCVFFYLPLQAPRSWNALEWSAQRNGWLFLTSSEESKDAALQLQSVWLDCIIHRLMSGELGPRRREQASSAASGCSDGSRFADDPTFSPAGQPNLLAERAAALRSY